MRETFTNAYHSIRTNGPIYAEQAKRFLQLAWHLTTTTASSAWQMSSHGASNTWQFLNTHSRNAWHRVRGTQPPASANAASPQVAAPASDASTASFVYTQVTRPVNWLYQRASVNLPSFLRSQPAVSPVAANTSATTEPKAKIA